jgi:hypothetical protein
MEHRISILFYARNSKKNSKGLSPIYICLTINGRRLDQSIGRSINPALWRAENLQKYLDAMSSFWNSN